MSSFTANYKVYPTAIDEGIWELTINTGSSVSPLGPRFNFGSGCPNFEWEFSDKQKALEACAEWESYFQKVAKKKK